MKHVHTLLLCITTAITAGIIETDSLKVLETLQQDFATELSWNTTDSNTPWQRVHTLYDKGETTKMIPTMDIFDRDDTFSTKGYGFLPNPISVQDEKSALILPSEIDGIVSVTMYDNRGNVVDYFQYSSEKGGLLEWDLKNLEGNRVHSGMYLAVVRIVSTSGKYMKKELLVGVKE